MTVTSMMMICRVLAFVQLAQAFHTSVLVPVPLSSRTTTTTSFRQSIVVHRRNHSLCNNKDQYVKQSNHNSLHMVGDFFSGISGRAPKSLDVPFDDILSGTNIDPSRDNVDLKCVYKASRDGWSAIDFHTNCDGRGSGLVVVLSQSGKKIGGFNPLGWQSTDDYGTTNAAFLWFSKGANNIVKCPVLSGGNAAIFDYATGGPQFGSADLIIGKPEAAVMGGFAGPDAEDTSKSAGDLRRGSSYIGGAYSGSFPFGGSFKVVEVEVYCNGNIKPIKSGGFNLWPF